LTTVHTPQYMYCFTGTMQHVTILLHSPNQVSRILNGTSRQLGYAEPFMLVHAGKYRTEDKLKIQSI